MFDARVRGLIVYGLALCFGLVVVPAVAADPVFLGSSAVGLQPPPGMRPAKSLAGLMTGRPDGFADGKASIFVSEMPESAQAVIDAQRDALVEKLGAKQAENVEVNGARGFLIRGVQSAGGQHLREWALLLGGKGVTAIIFATAPDSPDPTKAAAIETALKTVVFRPRPGLDQQIALLPFTVGDLAGFQASKVEYDNVLYLVDSAKDQDKTTIRAHAVAALVAGSVPGYEREGYPKAMLRDLPALGFSEDHSATKTFEADGSSWAAMTGKGREGDPEVPVQIGSYVRFGETGYLSIVCVAPDARAAEYDERCRKLALSVKSK